MVSQEAPPPAVASCGSDRYPVIHNPTASPSAAGTTPHPSSSRSARWEGGTRLDTCARLSSGGSRITSEQRRDPLPEQPGARTGQGPSAPSGPSPPVLSTSADLQPHFRMSMFLSRVSLPCAIVPERVAQARAALPSALNLPSSQPHLINSACSVYPPLPHPCPEKTIHMLTRRSGTLLVPLRGTQSKSHGPPEAASSRYRFHCCA